MRTLAITLTVAFLLLQHRLWLSEDGWRGLQGLTHELAAVRAENARLEARNLRLLEELGYLRPGVLQGGDAARDPALGRLAGNTRRVPAR
jgi:hypothetical protein